MCDERPIGRSWNRSTLKWNDGTMFVGGLTPQQIATADGLKRERMNAICADEACLDTLKACRNQFPLDNQTAVWTLILKMIVDAIE